MSADDYIDLCLWYFQGNYKGIVSRVDQSNAIAAATILMVMFGGLLN